VAQTLNNLANLQGDKNEFEQAEKSYQETLQIYRKLAQVNPQTYLSYVAGTLNNLGTLQSYKNEIEQAEQSFQESLQIYRKLAKNNPQIHLPYLAGTQINMGVFYQESVVDKELSIKLVDEAITNLLPFYEIPIVQNYLKSAFHVLINWDIDIDKYLEEKLKDNE